MLWLSTNNEICSTTADQQKNLNGIDILKFLCSILVFIIHIPPFYGDPSGLPRIVNFGLQHYICRLAVPFYFVCSGYFLFRKMSFYNLNTDRIKSYCFKILRLVGTWQILLFIGWTEHLWYLGATVVAVILLSLCFHFRIKYSWICLFACLLYMLGLLGDSYYGLIAPLKDITFFKYLFNSYEFAFDTTRNGVFMGFIFVLMGAGLSHREIAIKPLTAAIRFAVSMICLFAEICLLKYFDIPKGYNMYIFSIPAVYYLFAFAYTIQLKDSDIYRHLRNIGMLVYFLHISTNEIVSLAIRTLDNYWKLGLAQYLFVFSLVFTLLIAVYIEHLSCKDKFKWIRWLFS